MRNFGHGAKEFDAGPPAPAPHIRLVHHFRRLQVWRRSRAAALAVYRVTQTFPPEERFGIIAQVRRAALSVSTNIVEGTKRLSDRDFAHFLNIAEGSAAESKHLLEISADLGLGPAQAIGALATEFEEIERMLYALRRSIT